MTGMRVAMTGWRCYIGTIRACLGVGGLGWFFETVGGGAVGLGWRGVRVGPTKNFFVEG